MENQDILGEDHRLFRLIGESDKRVEEDHVATAYLIYTNMSSTKATSNRYECLGEKRGVDEGLR